jgi:hypothetical protein
MIGQGMFPDVWRRLKRNPSPVIFVLGLGFMLGLQGVMQPQAIDGVYFQRWSSEDMMQTVSVVDLRVEPLASLYYLHVQPPLLDAVRAALAQLWPAVDDLALVINVDRALYVLGAVIYAGLGALLCHWLTQLIDARWGAVGSIGFLLHPAAIFYATFLESTLLFSFLIAWSYFALWKLAKRGGSIVPLAISLILLYLTRALVQWPFLMLYVLALWLLRVPRRKIAAFAAIVGAVMGLYTLKQMTLFGVTYTSSFAGLNCYHGLGDYLDRYPEVGLPPAPPAPARVLINPVKATGVDNFNTMLYLKRHQLLMDSCLARWLRKPIGETLYAYVANFVNYLRPSAMFTTPHIIADQLPWRGLYNTVFSGLPLLLISIAAMFWWLRHAGRGHIRYGLALLLPAAAILVLSIGTEMGENMRYKFFLEPIWYVFLISQVHSFWQAARRARLPREAQPSEG